MKTNNIEEILNQIEQMLKETHSERIGMCEIDQISRHIWLLQDKLRRRNMQIKELKKKLANIPEVIIKDDETFDYAKKYGGIKTVKIERTQVVIVYNDENFGIIPRK